MVGAHLAGAKFRENVDLSSANLIKAVLDELVLSGPKWAGVKLNRAGLARGRVKNLSLDGLDHTGLKAAKAIFDKISFVRAWLTDSSFEDALFTKCDLSGTSACGSQ